jgi:hypothetical protein
MMMQCWQIRRRPWVMLGGLTVLMALVTGALAKEETTEERLRRDLAFLAGDECEGRGVETKGLEKAADYIAKQFQQAGLKPGGKNGSWFQPFTILGPAALQKGNKLVLHGPQGQAIELQEGADFTVLGVSGQAKLKAPVVFAGYGVSAPGYDDYKAADVKGKVVIVLRRVPRWDNTEAPFEGNRDQYAARDQRFTNAELHRAAAVIFVNDRSEAGDKLLKFSETSRGYSTGSIPSLHVKRSVVDHMLVSSLGQGLPELEKAIDHDLKPRTGELPGWTAAVETQVKRKELHVKNVIGVLDGSGTLANETVVIGAHYDHLGRGEIGSLAKGDERQKIHHGADDNGSGSTAVMELARRFGSLKDRQGRRLVFMTFSGEEKGLLGSRFYCNKEPLFPLAETAVMVNLDMVGRMQIDPKTDKGKLIAEGLGTAKGFTELIEKFNQKYDFQLAKKKGGTGPSDHDSFYRQKVPVFFLWTGLHKDYHRPSDTFDKINYKDMSRVVDLATDLIMYLSAEPKRPEYVEVKEPVISRGPGNIPKLGIRPAYDTDRKGLLVDAVTDDGPAAKGGMKAGDLIVAIGDLPVSNIETYMAALSKHKRGQPVQVTVERESKRIELKVTPQ